MSYTSESIEKLKAKAVAGYSSTRKILVRLGRMNAQKIDRIMQELHNREFEKINCLECANCCKSISPAMTGSDVRRMAAATKQSVPAFIDSYLHIDHEEDYVFKETPCPFLDDKNLCLIYESRPKACREYPHTDRKRFYQLLDLTAKNSTICPAVFNIIDKLKDSIR